ncbi:MAG: hypothetical protein LLG06_03315 [Desulfobacteraceae bacterium]|nr:hypothetical protein [Desulfobacteraceae bacterium]
MRSKALCVLTGFLFAASLLFAVDADARAGSSSSGSRGGSRSSSSSSSKASKPSSGGYGNTATNPSGYGRQSTAPPASSGGYGNSANPGASRASKPAQGPAKGSGYGNSAVGAVVGAGAGVAAASGKSPVQEKMNRSFSKQESAKAYSDYQAQQNKFATGQGSGAYNPGGRERTTVNSVRNRVTYTSGSNYYTRRTVFYDTYRWSPPVYVYNSYRSFGIWDAMILWFMLDHISDRQYAAMYYHHRDDPGMQQFRGEADRLSKENEELREKVRKMDESAKQLEREGVKSDPSYVPPDAADVVLAASVAEKEVPRSSGFPWVWVLAGAGAVGTLGYVMMRRRSR